MVNRDILSTKLTELRLRIERIVAHRTDSSAALAADVDALDLVSFNLMLAVQACSDIASHLIADEGWPTARTLSEAFVRLHQHGVISPTIRDALSRAAGLCNVVAHGYAGIDVNAVYVASTRGVSDLEAFAAEIARFVDALP